MSFEGQDTCHILTRKALQDDTNVAGISSVISVVCFSLKIKRSARTSILDFHLQNLTDTSGTHLDPFPNFWEICCHVSLKSWWQKYHQHYRFMALFPGPPRWAGARRELLDFMVQGEINRGRHTDHPAGRHSIRTTSTHLHHCPIFFTGQMLFLPPNQQCQSTEDNRNPNDRNTKREKVADLITCLLRLGNEGTRSHGEDKTETGAVEARVVSTMATLVTSSF